MHTELLLDDGALFRIQTRDRFDNNADFGASGVVGLVSVRELVQHVGLAAEAAEEEVAVVPVLPPRANAYHCRRGYAGRFGRSHVPDSPGTHIHTPITAPRDRPSTTGKVLRSGWIGQDFSMRIGKSVSFYMWSSLIALVRQVQMSAELNSLEGRFRTGRVLNRACGQQSDGGRAYALNGYASPVNLRGTQK